MTIAVEEKTRAARADRLFDPADGAKSLDEVVTTAWGGLALRGSARCLVCGAAAARTSETDDTEPAPADCPSCGSRLE